MPSYGDAGVKRRRESMASPLESHQRSRTVNSSRATQPRYRSSSHLSRSSQDFQTGPLSVEERRQGRPHSQSNRSALSFASSGTLAEDAPEWMRVRVPPNPLVDDFDDDQETLQEIVMAINVTDRNTIGCAYYTAREEKLLLMEDVQSGSPDIVDTCKSPRVTFRDKRF